LGRRSFLTRFPHVVARVANVNATHSQKAPQTNVETAGSTASRFEPDETARVATSHHSLPRLQRLLNLRT
jgi:hypothetical protein